MFAVASCGGGSPTSTAADPPRAERSAVAPSVSATPELDARISDALQRGGAFLVAQQDVDGALRASRYAALRDGHALTGLGVAALRFASDDDDAYRRGVDFVATLVGRDGRVRAVNYPYYATTTALIVVSTPGNDRHDAIREVLVRDIFGRQHGSSAGFADDDPNYGGWGYDLHAPVPGEGGANLSATLFAVGALRLAGVPVDDPSLAHARDFVLRCQAADGGFFMSPTVDGVNKAGESPTGPRSYGSMTADGLRVLRQLGLGPEHARVESATRWLTHRFRADANPGDFSELDEVRRASSYYYWAWTAAHALRGLGQRTITTEHGDVDWAEALATELVERQQPDGSWTNPATELREDDPLVATPLALAALAVAQSIIGGVHRTHAR